MLTDNEIKNQIDESTRWKLEKITSIIKHADEIKNDPEKEERLKHQFCVTCFYRVSIAGQRFTSTKCVSCNNDMIFSSTNVDKICSDCSKKYNACKKCMATI